MRINRNLTLAFAAIVIYLAGGASVFTGIGLLVFGRDVNLSGWGGGATIGYLWLAIGFCFSIIGVLIMRLSRNRGLL